MNPLLRSFDAIRETRTYVFDYDDTERLCLEVREAANGLFVIHLLTGTESSRADHWTRLHGYEKRPTLTKLAKVAREQIALRKAVARA